MLESDESDLFGIHHQLMEVSWITIYALKLEMNSLYTWNDNCRDQATLKY